MLGPAKPRRRNEPIAVSLADLVPADHFYRHVEAKLDLGFVRDWTREVYAERGRPVEAASLGGAKHRSTSGRRAESPPRVRLRPLLSSLSLGEARSTADNELVDRAA